MLLFMSCKYANTQRVYDDDDVDGEEESKEEKSQEINEDPLVAYREAFKTGLEALRYFYDDDSPGEVFYLILCHQQTSFILYSYILF